MTTLAEIEHAVNALPQDQKYALYRLLESQLQGKSGSEPLPSGHGVLDIPAVRLGPVLRPFDDVDLLDEMLEERS